MLNIFLRQSLAVAGKDFRSELRTKEALNAAFAFALAILVLFSFVTDVNDSETIYAMSGGLLWLTFLFAGALILNRSFAREIPNDCLDALLASPVPGSALWLGKALANFALILIVEAAAMPLFIVLYNIRWTQSALWLAAVAILATWGICVIGTLFSALTVNLRLRELMLPTLLYPMLIPALMSAMRLTTVLVSGQPISGDEWIWFRLLIGFDIIFTSLALLLVESILLG
jgi:heme exporter protein B